MVESSAWIEFLKGLLNFSPKLNLISVPPCEVLLYRTGTRRLLPGAVLRRRSRSFCERRPHWFSRRHQSVCLRTERPDRVYRCFWSLMYGSRDLRLVTQADSYV